jgi:hypothetical protein
MLPLLKCAMPDFDIAAKRRKKHKNQISGLVNSMCYNEQKSIFRLFTDPSILALIGYNLRHTVFFLIVFARLFNLSFTCPNYINLCFLFALRIKCISFLVK